MCGTNSDFPAERAWRTFILFPRLCRQRDSSVIQFANGLGGLEVASAIHPLSSNSTAGPVLTPVPQWDGLMLESASVTTVL